MRLLLIDDRGELRSERSQIVRTSFANVNVDGRVSSYLVKNLGFIALDLFRGSCQVRLRPSLITEESLATLEHWVRFHHYDRIALNAYDRGWQLSLFADAESFMTGLRALVASTEPNRVDDFISEPRSLKAVSELPALRAVLDNWEELAANLGRTTVSKLLKQATGGRYVIVRHRAAEDRFSIVDVGRGYVAYSSQFPREARGGPLEAQPDRDYARFVIEGFRRSLRTAAPCVDDVDALVTTEDLGRCRVRYRRLILSRPGRGGDNWILSSSVLDERIDLRAKVVAGFH